MRFDIDANGILSVTATDKGTGKQTDIKITGASTLPSDEVEKMVKDAEKNAEGGLSQRAARREGGEEGVGRWLMVGKGLACLAAGWLAVCLCSSSNSSLWAWKLGAQPPHAPSTSLRAHRPPPASLPCPPACVQRTARRAS